VSDIITNSSTTVYVWADKNSVKMMKEVISKIMKDLNVSGTPDDYFDIYVSLDDAVEWYWSDKLAGENIDDEDWDFIVRDGSKKSEDIEANIIILSRNIKNLRDDDVFEFIDRMGYNYYDSSDIPDEWRCKLNIISKNSKINFIDEILKAVNLDGRYDG